MNIYSVILAADFGKQMKSKTHKSLHPLCGKPIIGHILDTLKGITTASTVLVIGNDAEELQQYAGSGLNYTFQKTAEGTGQAIKQAGVWLEQEEGVTLVVNGDAPLLTEGTFHEMIRLHNHHRAGVTLLTAMIGKLPANGLILRDEKGTLTGVVKNGVAAADPDPIHEAYAGALLIDNQKLFKALDQADHEKGLQECGLTEIVAALRANGEELQSYCIPDSAEAAVINDRIDLAQAEKELRERITRTHMLNGVTIVDPANTYIEANVTIARDTVILPGCFLRGATHIGEDCVIGPNSDITDSRIGNAVEVKHSVLTEAEVGDRSHIGPYAYLRPGSKLGSEVKVGDFVEIKNSSLGDKSKVSHLSYIGDASVGEDVNIGCGAITVNYDGFRKHRTEIGDFAFIGSNVNLIAPLKIGKGAFVVAGSTITSSIEDGDVGIARERQVTKPGYADKLRKKLEAQSNKKSK
ncbi:bifunctional UDP-N-acetylglucosamine diphosphorylase/glucosamine-1-phosphate N-acetyltransferase GlmU [Paenibacillus senegalensis]|uniref:bifunctional UDP-N-acetylglucosamine diphosphorylase/glucosamine-1-phosphate N-acetyltransferase GlmU n=1 Tax=Paenibacillus senegalensis TaxID=1465766 RepID=UPI0002898073|nr:bifunctional UDP-N-acetylglucosamine diphosphorylase/glucosamine-1-phosphate N-acetyltransferase GlmU [Paenibacillus senegalensis]